jgi:hypothetical protein
MIVPTGLTSLKKCHRTETQPVWPLVRRSRTRRLQKINMSRELRSYTVVASLFWVSP